MRYRVALAVALLVFPAGPAAAEDDGAVRSVKILLTSLSFDRALARRAQGNELFIAVAGACPTGAVLRQAAGKKIRDLTIRVFDLDPDADAPKQFEDGHAGVAFVCKDADPALFKAASDAGALTMTDDGEAVKNHAAVGVESRDGRTSLVLNINTARRQGADFDPRIFGVARVID